MRMLLESSCSGKSHARKTENPDWDSKPWTACTTFDIDPMAAEVVITVLPHHASL